jgi:hypothetical protein
MLEEVDNECQCSSFGWLSPRGHRDCAILRGRFSCRHAHAMHGCGWLRPLRSWSHCRSGTSNLGNRIWGLLAHRAVPPQAGLSRCGWTRAHDGRKTTVRMRLTMTVSAQVLVGLAFVAVVIAQFGGVDSVLAGVGPCAVGPNCGGYPAPGPIVGAGLPILAIGFGAYWLIGRFRNRV